MGMIVWLASYPKSGNTWLRAFLANIIADSDTPVPFSEYWRYATNEASGHWYEPRLGGTIKARHLHQVAQLRLAVQQDIADAKTNHSLVKTHSLFGSAFGHPQINVGVTAAAIYVVRNPLDVAISFAKHNNTPIDAAITSMAQQSTRSTMRTDRVFEWIGDWSGHVASWTSGENPNVLVIRYEDMLDDPRHAFHRVVSFLKMQTSREQFDRALEFSSFDRLQKMEQETGFEEKPDGADAFFRVGRMDQWREVLTKEQVARVVARHREQMQRFNYVPD